MGVQIAELTGGIIFLVVEGLILWGLLELGCSIFFKMKERESKGE